MHIFKLIILGIVQGLTEFLPISSSGHLVLAQHIFEGFHRSDVCLEVFLHMGTLLAVLVYFRRDIQQIFTDLFSKDEDSCFHGKRWALFIILGSVPTALIGFLFEGWFKRMFTNVRAVCISLIITGLLLWVSDRVKDKNKGIEGMKIWDALGIGFVQGLAITPGISRSGFTITTGIFLGLDRDLAARFSFLLSIPALFGAFLFEFKDMCEALTVNRMGYLIGGFWAAVVGYLSIVILLKMVVSKRLSPFAYYCWAVGLMGLIFI